MESRKIVGSAEQAGAIAYFAVLLTIIVFADNKDGSSTSWRVSWRVQWWPSAAA
jgi:hypothetical protein